MLAAVQPFYFGEPESQLFGCCHPPSIPGQGRAAVVLCHPMGEEYIRFHRALRQLALQLSSRGFAVLRFDLSGCGDSAGDEQDWRMSQWQKDLILAIVEMRQRHPQLLTALVGLRLGATIAATVAAAQGGVHALVLWDPVVNGQAYLQELRTLHRGMLLRAHVLPRPPKGQPEVAMGHDAPDHDGASEELLGFALTPAFRADITAVSLQGLDRAPAPQALLLQSTPASNYVALRQRLESLGTRVSSLSRPEPHLWVWQEGVGKVAVPHPVLQAISSWLEEACS